MRVLLKDAKDRVHERKAQIVKRIPGRENRLERAQSRGRRTVRRLREEGRRAGSTVRSALSEARETAEAGLHGRERRERRRGRKRAGTAAAAGVAGGAGAYFLDPNSGKRRRHIARDKATSLIGRGERRLERAGRQGANAAAGRAKGGAAGLGPEKPAQNDEALADRVRSEVFRPGDAPKGSVNVNVEGGIVYLRGEADRKQARKLVKSARAVDGVEEVKSLLSTPA